MKSAWRSLARLALSLAAFLGGLVAVCLGLAATVPPPEIEEVTAKLAYWRAHANEYDTLFLGSSRIYHQMVPSLFDEIAGQRGLKTKSFNAAIDGMRPPELNYYIDQLLAANPQNLRWIFIETGGVRLTDFDERGATVRDVYWHDWQRLSLIARVALAYREVPRKAKLMTVVKSYQKPLNTISQHFGIFVRRFLHLGGASVFMEPLLPISYENVHRVVLGPDRDGFRNTGRAETILPEKRKELEAGVEARRRKPFTVDYGDPVSQESFEAMLALFEKRGATTVQVIPPTTGARKFHLRSENESGRLLLDYSDLDQYPELFEAKYRVDSDHLNHEGAQIFTRLVVEQFCTRYAPKP